MQAVFSGFRRSRAEFPVGDGFHEKLNRVDLQDARAYELKVSKNNTHFEFYRDIFKVVVHNAHQPRWPILKLIFTTPTEVATKLATRSGQAGRALAEPHHSLAVEICGI